MAPPPTDRDRAREAAWPAALPRQDRIFGELAIARGLVPERVVEECARSFRGEGGATSLSEVLVERGHLSLDDARALEDQTLVVQAALPPELKAGDRLGEFRIVRQIGRGGMGVVYEAVQEALGRPVALKVLPPGHAANESLVLRFLREAHAIAGLNHPNIVPVFTSGQAQGVLYFAMEFVPGRSLEALLADGPADPRRAARIVHGAALGLAHAHARGMVHRDIKPGNILLDRDDRPRITDFGLVREEGAATITRSAAVLGTPAYMSPEQARGEPVDGRSDTYALGAVLYALLAGKAPYGDASSGSGNVLARVLTGPPTPLRSARPDTPPALDAIVARAMARDRDARYDAAAALADDLLRYLEGQPVVAEQERRRGRRRRLASRAATGAAVCGLIAAIAAAAWLLLPRAARRAEAPVRARALQQVTRLPGRQLHPSLSPDGRWVAFDSAADGNNDVMIQQVDGSAPPRNLTSACAVYDGQPAFSPDGRLIAFRSHRDGGGIFVVAPDGSGLRRVTQEGYDPAWSPDGRQIAYATDPATGPTRRRSSELLVVDLASGRRRKLRDKDAVQPSWSPGGRRIAYWESHAGPSGGSLWTADADTGRARRLTSGPFSDWAPAWAPDGRHVFFTSNRGGSSGIWRIAIDEATGEPLGRPEPVALGTAMESLFVSLSADGRRLAFTSWNVRDTMKEAAFDPATGTLASIPRNIARQPRMSRFVDLSPSGAELAFVDREAGERLVVAGRNGDDPRKIVAGGGRERSVRWSPDGRWIAFQSDRETGSMQVFVIRPDGSGLRRITPGPTPHVYPAWSPDGRSLLASHDDGTSFVFAADAPAPAPPRERFPPVPDTPAPFRAWSWSADGRTIAGAANGIVLYDVAARSYRRLTRGDGAFPVWAGRGPWLVFWDAKADALRVANAATGATRDLLSEKPDQIGPYFGLTRDGRTLLFTSSLNDGQVWVMDLE